jgi:hypothetical protein
MKRKIKLPNQDSIRSHRMAARVKLPKKAKQND